jgi:hypothetical protein
MPSPSVAEILRSHVTLELEGVDRLYLNVYMPRLQSPAGVAWYLRHQRGRTVRLVGAAETDQ